MIQSFKDLKVYEKSYALSVELYRYANTLPSEERFGLASQLKRAGTSIPLNIAEGYGKRESAAEFKRYLMMAKGSCNEMQVLLDLCGDLGYMDQADHGRWTGAYDEIGRMLNGLIEKWESERTKI